MLVKITDVRYLGGDSAFLVDDGKTAILYDSGFGFTSDKVSENIKAQLKGRSLDYIFLTHSHYDHALGAAGILRHFRDAKVVAGEYASEIFKRDGAKSVMSDLDRKFAVKNGVSDYHDLTDGLRVDIPVKDGDKVKTGDMEFTVYNLPGHTRCSIGFYLESQKLLLSCETIGVYCGEGVVIPSYLVGYELTVESIKRVQNLDVEYMLVPHYGVIEKDEVKAYLKAALENAVTTAEEIKEMLISGETEEDAVNFFKDKYYHGIVKEVYPYDAMMLNTTIMVRLIKRELL